jgi:ABC-type multidrug transport system ATPase subunit
LKSIEETSVPVRREIIATLREVTVTFDGYQTRSLSRVNLDVARGEVLGVLGAKGAGKSTALGILAGRLNATEGKVKVFGRSPRRGATKARIGYLPDASVSDRPQGFFGRLFGRKKISSQTARGASRITPVVLGNRDLLILDEPFAGLGPAETTEAKALIRELAGRGKTVVISSDALMDIKDLCQRFVVFHEGKIQAVGTLEELLAAGGAIRFFPAVLPRETVERVLAVLREEILSNATGTGESSDSRKEGFRAKSAAPLESETQLTASARPKGTAIESASPKSDDPIDHERLEGLTKPNPSK